ncbi:MAG: type IX secretion system sortase PorU [Flavobacteriaceae bacterium]|jgi:hypothetical protein|nr:type IX secretion system sortase PorU [Flavobacteriaceae bacterium]
MRKVFLIVFFTAFLHTIAQEKSYSIKWQALKALHYSDSSLKYPFAEIDKGLYDINDKQAVVTDYIEELLEDKEYYIKVDKIVWESISTKEMGALVLGELPKEILPKIKRVKGRESIQSYIQFFPIINDNGKVKRLLEVKFSFESISTPSNLVSRSIVKGRNSSVLRNGKWHRFAVDNTGIYKIDRDFLVQLGVPKNVDPRTIKIFGNGGRMLPLVNNNAYEQDPIESSITVIGEEDGVFDSDDYILFYGVGIDQWSEENLTYRNLYEDYGVYFLTYEGEMGKRITTLKEETGIVSKVFKTYNASAFYEKELINVGKVGRKWFGEQFSVSGKQDFVLKLPNLNNNYDVEVGINTASASYGSSSFQFLINNNAVGGVSFSSLQSTTNKAYESFFKTRTRINGEDAVIGMVYNNGGVPNSEGYLDYIELKYIGNLVGGVRQYSFINFEAQKENGLVAYELVDLDNVQEVWKITDSYNIEKIVVDNHVSFQWKTKGGVLDYFHLNNKKDYYKPVLIGNSVISNQDLKGSVFNEGDIDYLIITNSKLKNSADRLANFHRQANKFIVKVVTVEAIYNEFGAGKQDIAAIRNFIRYIYNNSTSLDKRLKYVNLFGDTSYDYKNRVKGNTGIVPSFHSLNQNKEVTNSASNFSLYTTFMSDEFFCLMDNEEGLMEDALYGIDLVVGRILASTTEEADTMVDKVIKYHSKESYGKWKNNIVAIADDVDKISDFVLEKESDAIIEEIVKENPFYNSKKIYLDAYPQEVTAGGNRYPKAHKDIIDSFENGALYINYLGHGGEEALSQERVFTIDDAKELQNAKMLPLFVTITCEFTRFDNPSKNTGGQTIYKNKNGGAIALVATNRQIGIDSGRSLNRMFSNELFAKENNSSNSQLTIAEALMKTKNKTTLRDKNVISYIGDPALKLAIPKQKIVLTSINDKKVEEGIEEVKALDYVKLTGEVQNEEGVIFSDFTGDLGVHFFDKQIDRKTLGNDGIEVDGKRLIMDFKTLGETVFRGNVSVEKGKFSVDFILPKDIKLEVGKGKLSFYANNPQVDYTGADTEILIGGYNANAIEDKKPPVVKLYLNDESFVSGGTVNNKPVLLAFLEDESGINTASGIGHDITAILDDNEQDIIVLNDYYETELNNFRKGKIVYPFKEMSTGTHVLKVKSWDVYNNLTISEVHFVIMNKEGLKITNVLNYPNPFVNFTEFWFTHNQPQKLLEVQVQIMTVAGRIVKTINQQVISEGTLSRDIKWDGLDDFGDKLGKGVYIYKLVVRLNNTGEQVEKIEKIVIL